MTQVKKITIGDRFVVLKEINGSPTMGTVIALTSQPGKRIGIKLDEQVGYHSCDGRCEDGYGAWVMADGILTEAEYEDLKAEQKAASQPQFEEFTSITLD